MSLVLEQVAITLGGRPLVSGVSLELHPGEVVGLLGPNGAGKTTTFNMVTGLLRVHLSYQLSIKDQLYERFALLIHARLMP